MALEKHIKIRRYAVRGLAQLAAWIFLVWGVLAFGKGIWDLAAGEPEANYFSKEPWQFVTKDQWRRYGGFELAYGAAAFLIGCGAKRYALKLPIWNERPEPGELF